MSLDVNNSRLRSKRTQMTKTRHPAFDGSDSEDEGGKSKAELFRELILQDYAPENASLKPATSSKRKHGRLIHAIESPLKKILHKREQTKTNFFMINEDISSNSNTLDGSSPNAPIAGITNLDRSMSPVVKGSTKRRRRFTVGEAPLSRHEYPFGQDNQIILEMIQKYRASLYPYKDSEPDPSPPQRANALFSLTTSALANSAPETSLLRELNLKNGGSIPALGRSRPRRMSLALPSISYEWKQAEDPAFIHVSPTTRLIVGASGRRSSEGLAFDWARRDVSPPSMQNQPNTELNVSQNSTSSINVKVHSDPPPGPASVAKVARPPENAAIESEAAPFIIAEDRSGKLKKSMPRGMKISAPATNEVSNFLDFAATTPRTPPIPPPRKENNTSTTFESIQGRSNPSVGGSESRFSKDSGSSSVSSSAAAIDGRTASPHKGLKFQVVAKAAARLLGTHRSSTEVLPPPVASTFPPLLYSFAVPIEEHTLAISTRVKEEFKLKLKSQFNIPSRDAATEEELLEEVKDINDEIGRCAKEAVKLMLKARGEVVKARKSDERVRRMEDGARTSLNQFMVTRVFQPFSIELDPEADEVLRERYLQIVPNVPQFIAARWRVLASSSTSRPIQQLTTALMVLAAEASSLLLGEAVSDEKLSQETDKILLPVIRHAYLLAHFIHLEMVTYDYDIFFGTELGGWISLVQEEDRNRSKVPQSLESRVSGYWSLGLRKRRFIGEGVSQRRVWDVLLKARVKIESGVLPAV